MAPERSRSRRGRRLLSAYLLAVLVVAVGRELRRGPSARTWHGRALGAPYDLRRPTLRRVLTPHLDPSGPLVGPQGFGVGWAVNLGALARRLGLPV